MEFSLDELAVFAGGTEVFMAIVDEEGIIKKANERWYEKFRVEKNDFLGSSIVSYIHSNDHEAFEEFLRYLRHKKQISNRLVQLVDKDLKSFTFQFDLTFHEELIYLVGFDVTDHYKEHQSLMEMSSMAKVGAWYHDPIRDQNFWSDECYRIHDLEVGEPITAEKALGFFTNSHRKEINRLIDRLYSEHEPYDYVGEIVTAKGKKKWIRTHASPTVHKGKLIFIYGITADQTRLYTNLKRIENESETRELALKGIKSGLFDHDLTTDQVFYSPSFKDMIGLPKSTRLPEPEFRKLIHPDERERAYQQHLDELRKDGNLYFNQYRLKTLGGGYQYYEVYGWVKRDQNGKPVRMVGNLINVHDKVLIQQERARIMNSLEAMVDNGFIYSLLLNTEGEILLTDQDTNEIVRHEYGIDAKKETVKYVDVMPDSFKKTFSEEFSRALAGNTVRKEVERPLLDGSMQWLDIMYRPIRNDEDEIVFVLTNLMDISERKKAELSIKEAELQANQLSDLKSKILSDLSHEIRTPLNGIMGVNDMLLKRKRDEEEIKLLETQRESSVRLLKTLTDMIVLSSQYSIKENIKTVHFDANSAVQTCYDMYVHMANMKKLKYELQLADQYPKIIADKAFFTASLGAIINNALKYTEKGKVSVKSEYHPKEGNISIIVEDSGKGIDSRDFGRIFEDQTDGKLGLYKKFEESGIGLGVAKKYIESMDGSIHVASSLNKGTEFIITMPSEA